MKGNITIGVVGESVVKSIPAALNHVVSRANISSKTQLIAEIGLAAKSGAHLTRQESISGLEVSKTVSCIMYQGSSWTQRDRQSHQKIEKTAVLYIRWLFQENQRMKVTHLSKSGYMLFIARKCKSLYNVRNTPLLDRKIAPK